MGEKKENGWLWNRQCISYIAVGGVSALVEWIVFWLLGKLFEMGYLPAAVLAFIFSTSTNWSLGRTFTFKNSNFGKNKIREIIQVFGVSVIGLLMSLTLMYIFVNLLSMETDFLKTVAKILATGTVFIWNYLSRKLWIYRKKDQNDEG